MARVFFEYVFCIVCSRAKIISRWAQIYEVSFDLVGLLEIMNRWILPPEINTRQINRSKFTLIRVCSPFDGNSHVILWFRSSKTRWILFSGFFFFFLLLDSWLASCSASSVSKCVTRHTEMVARHFVLPALQTNKIKCGFVFLLARFDKFLKCHSNNCSCFFFSFLSRFKCSH